MKYQNNFVSSYLFLKNIPVLMDKGISLHDLLNSSIFDVVFDFDYWPGNHYNNDECIRAFNGSYFDIRQSYDVVFPDIRPMEEMDKPQDKQEHHHDHNEEGHSHSVGQIDKQKVYKIKYSVNLLAQIDMHVIQNKDGSTHFDNEGVSLMHLCQDTEELEIFDTPSLQQVIQYKWDTYGRQHHVLGCAMHMLYTLILIIYVKNAYLVVNDQ